MDNPYKTIQPVDKIRQVYYQEQRPIDVWHEVLSNDADEIHNLCNEMRQLVFSVGIPKWLVVLSAKILYHVVYKRWGHYIKESDHIASTCKGISPSLLAFLQRQYTLSHMGCSVVMAWDEQNNEMLAFRSLDWQGSNDIARSTRQYHFVNDEGEEVAKVAGVAGMVGVLTGVKPGFSIAINFAPWKRSAQFKSDPTFLIRKLLEDPDIVDYQSAYEQIKTWVVGSPCFISLCGVNKGEAAVFELGARQLMHVRDMGEKSFIVQTNHYDQSTSPFTKHNAPPIPGGGDDDELYHSALMPNSQRRQELITRELQSMSSVESKEEVLKRIFVRPPVLNWETAQWVVMRPGTGSMTIYSCEDK
ncbi:MAG: hypothetical protein OQL16_02140 [Gammaproteobacteria bacterium]|nr:hypothetical protein [Gammaproteobacteria bacterium]